MTAGAASEPAGPGLRGLPFLASLRGYQPAFLAPDLLAGLTLAAIAIPEQMATARLGGFAPQVGFFAFIAAGLAFAVFGVSRRTSTGADSTITPIFAGALALVAASGSPHYAALAAGLALMVGVIVAAAGFLRMGWIGNLLSGPVTLGFLAGIAAHIVVSQLPAALGLPALSGSTLSRIAALAHLIPHANLVAVALTAGVIAVVAGAHVVAPRLPGALAAVVLATLANAWLHLTDRGVTLLGHVAGGLPRVAVPALTAGDLLHLAPLAFIIAMVVMVQTAATGRSFPPEGGEADPAGDFIGVGAANILAGVLGAFPVNASPRASAGLLRERRANGRSPAWWLRAWCWPCDIVDAGILSGIPEAALSGILLFVAARIVRLKEMVQVFASSPIEAALIVATAVAIVVLPIENGVALGIGLSLLQGLWASARMRVRPMGKIAGTSVVAAHRDRRARGRRGGDGGHLPGRPDFPQRRPVRGGNAGRHPTGQVGGQAGGARGGRDRWHRFHLRCPELQGRAERLQGRRRRLRPGAAGVGGRPARSGAVGAGRSDRRRPHLRLGGRRRGDPLAWPGYVNAPTRPGRAARVLLVLGSLDGGGAERVAVTLLSRCDERLVDIRLGLLRPSGAYLGDVDPGRVTGPRVARRGGGPPSSPRGISPQ